MRLGSVRLAAGLISVFILMLVLGVVVPQADPHDMALYNDFEASYPTLAHLVSLTGAHRLFSGWPIIIVTLLLVVNVSACTVRRALQRQAAGPRLGASARWVECADADTAIRSAESELKSAGWSVVRHDGAIVGARGGIGFLGSMVLHVSLVVMALGGVFTYLATFSGDIVLTEGETLVDSRAAYYRIYSEPRIGEGFTGIRLTQGPTRFRYQDGQVISAISRLRTLDEQGNSVQKDVRVNHPLDVGGKSYLLLDSGYAVAMLLKVPGGAAAPAVVRLIEQDDGTWFDQISLGGEDAGVLNLEATPVPLRRGESMPVEKFSLDDPRLLVSLTTSAGPSDVVELSEGGSHTFADGTEITFEELRLWNKYFARSEPGRWVTYVGFWMSVVGALVRFVVPERRVSVGVGRGIHSGSVGVAYSCRPWSTPLSAGDADVVERITRVVDATSGIACEEVEDASV